MDKKELILEQAIGVFAAYGFRRCSMEDIASAAGVSRPALYLHFRNKAAVFRAASEQMQRRGIDAAEQVREGPLALRLSEMLFRYKEPVWRVHATTPHGKELTDLNAEVAEDVTHAAMDRMAGILAAAIAPQMAPGWNAENVARLLMGAAWSVVERAETEDAFRADLATLAAIWAKAMVSPR